MRAAELAVHGAAGQGAAVAGAGGVPGEPGAAGAGRAGGPHNRNYVMLGQQDRQVAADPPHLGRIIGHGEALRLEQHGAQEVQHRLRAAQSGSQGLAQKRAQGLEDGNKVIQILQQKTREVEVQEMGLLNMLIQALKKK